MEIERSNNGAITKITEYNSDGSICYSYKLNDRICSRIITNVYEDENGLEYKVIEKAKLLYAEDCELNIMTIDGEDYISVIKKGSKQLEKADVIKKIHIKNNNQFEQFSVKNELVKKWTSLLKNYISPVIY